MRGSSRAGLIDVVESAYRAAPDEQTWLTGVAESMLPLMDHGLGLSALAYHAPTPDSFRVTAVAVLGMPPEAGKRIADLQSHLSPAAAARLYLPGVPLGLVSDQLDPRTAGPELAVLGPFLAGLGGVDGLGSVSSDPSGHGCCVTALVPARRPPSPSKRRLFGRITTHIAAGLRLVRAAPAEPEAILDPSGRLLHAEEPAKTGSARETLRRAAKDMDRARGKLRREDPAEALEIWRGLVEGRWSLVDRFESDGRRYLIAHRNDPDMSDPRILTPRERQVVGYVAMGHANKLVGYALGLSASSVATHLAAAMRKLGVRTRAELVSLVGALGARED